MKLKIYFRALLLTFAVFFISNQSFAQTFTGANFNINDVVSNSGTVAVSGVGTVANGADISLRLQFNHTFLGDLAIWLVAPGGQVLELCTRNGGGNNNADITFSDAAATNIATAVAATSTGVGGCPPTTFGYNGSFKPEGRNNVMPPFPTSPSDAPAPGTFTFANTYSGLNANGTWTLFINDHAGGDVGATCIWSITIVPQLAPCTAGAYQLFTNSTPVAIPTGPAVVTSTITVAGALPYLNDVNIQTFITHTFAADLDITITSPAGTVVTLTTDNGGANDDVFNGTVWDDNANPGGQVPYTNNNGMATDHLYANLTLASPLAPEEPLGAFIGENPNGVWTITISDDLAGDGGSLNSWSLSLSGLPAAPVTALTTATNSTPVAIPTGPAVVTSTILIAGAGTQISDVNLTTFIQHTFAADLDITIMSPAGTVVTLTTDNGAGNDNVFNGTVWDDDANPGGTVPYVNNNGLASDHLYVDLTLASPLAPEEGLAAFNGENPNGTWTITISDDLAGDGGSLDSWTLNIRTSLCNPAPTCLLTCPANIVVNNDPNQCGAVVNFPAPTTTGACGVVTATPASGSFFPRGITTVNVTSSVGGGLCSFTVRVNDVQPPTITCPANITVGNTAGQCGAFVNFPAPTTTDNCPGVTIVSNPASGSFFPKGTTTVTSTATDAGGNTATCTFTVTVNDTQAPTITCPANITRNNDPGICGAVVTYALPAISDNCGFPGPQVLSQTTSQSIGPTIQIGCQAGGFHTDNSYWRSYNLGALGLPGALTVNTLTFGIERADANGTGTTQPVTVRLYTSSAAFPAGVLTQVATQTVQVPDQINSLFTVNLAAPPTVPANAILVYEVFTPDGRPPVNNIFFIGSNNLGQSQPCYISAVACGVPTPVTLASLGFPNMHIVMNIGGVVAGPNPLTQIAGLASGSTFPVGTTTNTYRVTDVAGNTATCSFNVTVNDNQAPAITCPGSITVSTPIGSCVATVNYTVTSSDNCPGVTQALISGLASGSAFPLGVNTVTWRATDASGNTSTCSFTVTVNDGQLPVITAQPANRTACSGSNATFSVTATNVLTYQWQAFNSSTSTWGNIAGANASTYTVNGVNVGMNTNSFRVIITGLCTVVTSTHASLYVNPLPVVTVSANPTPVLLPNQTTTLSASGNPSGGTFSWILVGGNPPVVSTASSFTVGVDGIGTYHVVYTDPNGCVSTSSDIVVSGAPSGNLYVYPNPNRGTFTVRYYNTNNESATVNVYDARGARVHRSAIVTSTPYSQITITLGSVTPAGVYIVELVNSSGKKIGAQRIVVEK
jgi:subtilisin-like proprotein convertase family protein